MRFFFPLFTVLLFACAHRPEKAHFTSAAPVDWEKMWIQNGCNLFNWDRELKTYPGSFCVFLEDGSFLSATETALRRFSPSREILWEVPGHFHHQLNLTPDKKRIMTLSSKIVESKKKKIRYDVFLIFDLNGNLLHKGDSIPVLKQSGVKELVWVGSTVLPVVKADMEGTHFNSIYEIPENAYSKTVPWMKEGNIIVNSSGLGIFILSPDLSKTLKHINIKNYHYPSFHDAQVSPDGTILYFNNRTYDPNYARFSTIQRFDPVLEKITYEFRASPKETFYSPACGGVQEVGDLLFFSHVTAGGYLWSPAKKEMVKYAAGTDGDPTSVSPTQQLKFVDVDSFLKNSK